jgi:hypothetical protein
MSSINGDKSRFNRVRKQRIFQRQRNRDLVHGLILSNSAHPKVESKEPLPTPPATRPGEVQP